MCLLVWLRRVRAVLAICRRSMDGGFVLIGAACVALIWANSPAGDAYTALLDLSIGFHVGVRRFSLPVAGWVNDAFMALFFLLVGLEIRRELTEGQLASIRRAVTPAAAALGGIAVPALIYVAFTWRTPALLRGWAIPIATDIAFSLAVLRLLGRRVPAGLRVFLTALAIIDDLGAIAVIALFYADIRDAVALAAATLLCGALWLLGRAGVRALSPFMIGCALLWVLLAGAGVHPTLAGVAIAFLVPNDTREGVSPAQRLEHVLVGWVNYIVLPLFGLANAGLRLDAMTPTMLTNPAVAGIALGLFIGKQVGVFGATWLACRLGVARLPTQVSWWLLYGTAVLCGIGFTMSLFIGDLAFADPQHQTAVRGAVFAASMASALAGAGVLLVCARRRG